MEERERAAHLSTDKSQKLLRRWLRGESTPGVPHLRDSSCSYTLINISYAIKARAVFPFKVSAYRLFPGSTSQPFQMANKVSALCVCVCIRLGTVFPFCSPPSSLPTPPVHPLPAHTGNLTPLSLGVDPPATCPTGPSPKALGTHSSPTPPLHL